VLTTKAAHLLYQGWWYSRKYRRTRKRVRRILESPIRLRRCWYLNFRWWARAGLAWLGVPFRVYPQFKAANTAAGPVIKMVGALLWFVVVSFRAQALVGGLRRGLSWLVSRAKQA